MHIGKRRLFDIMALGVGDYSGDGERCLFEEIRRS